MNLSENSFRRISKNREGPSYEQLLKEVTDLKDQLNEAKETLLAIQSGSIDALVINNVSGSKIFTLEGADYPYRILIENMFEGAATISNDFDVIYCNRRLSEMLQMDYKQIVGKPVDTFIYPGDLPIFERILDKGKTETNNGEIRIQSNSGKITEVLLSCTPLNLENALICLIFVELTDIKKIQAELRSVNENLDALVQQRTAELEENRQRWVTTLASIGDAVIATNTRGGITFMNPEAERLTGWNSEEALEKSINKVLNLKKEKKVIIRDKFNEVLTEGKTIVLAKGNFLISRRNGREIPIDDRAAPIKNEIGQTTGIVYIFRDISERINADKELRESEAHLRALITATSNIVFRLNPDISRISIINLGQTRALNDYSFQDFLQYMIPSDYHELILSEINKATRSKSVFEIEHPSRGVEGKPGWMLTRAVPIFNNKNEITEWFGISSDITARKETEQALIESERRYSALFANKLNAMAHCRIITDEQGKPVDLLHLQVNEAYEEIMGIQKKDIEGRTIKEVFPSDNENAYAFLEIYGKVALEGKEERFEIYFEPSDQYLSIYAYSPKPGEFITIFTDITMRIMAEKALLESEEKFSVMFQAAPIGIALNTLEDRKIYDVNQAFLDLIGFANKEEVIGKTSPELGIFPESEKQDMLKREEVVSKFNKLGKVQNALQILVDKKRLQHYVNLNLNTIEIKDKPFILTTIEDITHLKKVENALRESEQRWATTLKSIGDAVISNDTEGNITFLNQKAEDLTGWNHVEVLRKPIRQFLTIVEDETFRPVKFREIGDLAVEQMADDRLLINRERKKIPIEYSVSPIVTREGEKLGAVLIFRDISQRKQVENVIKNYNLQLEETVKIRTAELEMAKERAESADKLKTAFLLNMSHELRTPLNSIIGFSGILLKQMAGPLNPEQEKQLEMVQASGRHLLSLISDILDISKIEAGELKPEYVTFDLLEVIDDVLKSVEPQAVNKKLEVIFKKPGTELIITSDKLRLRQVLINLVYNAVKFTEKGMILIQCGRENGSLKLEVTDTGIGIREEDLDMLFNPFIQLENNLTRRFEGSGLGLSISKKIVDMLEGTIEVKSKYGSGSTFLITLPVKD